MTTNTNKKPFISVIIPVFNRGKLILETINSVLSQTYNDFEIVIVDDGSTDDTKTVIEKINDSRIRYFYQQNSGPSVARNNGIKISNGEYIAFLDSDDLWKPYKLEKQVDVINNNPDVKVVMSYSEVIPQKNKFNVQMGKIKCGIDYIKAVLLFPEITKDLPQTSSVMFSKECFEEIGGFNESMISREDVDLFCRLSLNYKVHLVDEPLTFRRMHNESLMNITSIEKLVDNNIKFLDKLYESQSLPDEILNLKKKAYSNIYFIVGWRALYQAKNPVLARSLFIKSFKYSLRNLKNKSFVVAFIASLFPIKFIEHLKKLMSEIKNLRGSERTQ